jgi:hypothetical protein
MGFLDWMKHDQNAASGSAEVRKDAELPYMTKRGNPIMPLHAGAWYHDDIGRSQLRHHLGISKEGYHGGLEASLANGERVFRWSNAREESIKAEGASYAMGEMWDREHGARTKVVWIGDVYQGKGKEAWGFVERNEAGRYDSGIAVYTDGEGVNAGHTARECTTAEIGIQEAKKGFDEWRSEFAHEMTPAPEEITKDMYRRYGFAQEERKISTCERSHGWER